MATYNGERFLSEQLESVLSQSYSNIELIVVDDGSVDGTVALVESYSKRYPAIRLYVNEENLGYIKNFEKGMLLANGEYIALSDQDDIWRKDKLALLLEQIGSHEIIYSNSLLIDDAGNSLGKYMSDIRNQINYTDCLMYTIGAWAPGHAMLFRKELITRCLPFPQLVTHDFWLGFVAACKGTVAYINLPLVYYRQHGANAIGADTHGNKGGGRGRRQKKMRQSRDRMQLLYEKCPLEKIEQKKILKTIYNSYLSFSLKNNWTRMITFFKYRDLILAYKKKSALMRILFCLKMFFKID
ncbi:MAG: glycosyltransferase family 2 protein [Chitinophagaceae bacterium]|nr:glycosyltransferase family 2 protein [Chitinophagaceae bacterium]